MLFIKYPDPGFRIKNEAGKQYIFDAIRKMWLVLTEEEWVRQNFISYLIKEMNYPSTLIALEKELQLGELKKRFDILIYDRDHTPWMLVECKAPAVKLNEDVLQQALRYNISVPVRYIIITNGIATCGWGKEGAALHKLEALPGCE